MLVYATYPVEEIAAMVAGVWTPYSALTTFFTFRKPQDGYWLGTRAWFYVISSGTNVSHFEALIKYRTCTGGVSIDVPLPVLNRKFSFSDIGQQFFWRRHV